MNPWEVARELQRLGFPTIRTEGATESTDGMVEITDLVHVQVPTFESGLCVVSMSADGEEFKHHPIRANVVDLIPDIKEAMGLVATRKVKSKP